MVKLNLLGSCVTRDAFSNQNDFTIKNYFARTSFISIVSEPVKVEMEDINLSSNFQKKSVHQDANKSILTGLLDEPSDYLIIDLIDERFNLAKIGNSIITMSNELKGSNLLEKFPNIEINRFDNGVFDLWKKSVDEFFNAVFKVYGHNQVILHKTFWREKYLDKAGEVQEFSSVMANGIRKQNNLLNSYYEYMETFISKMNVIDMTDSNIYSNENHIWGLSPYHFEDKYYELFNNKLNELVGAPAFDYDSTPIGNIMGFLKSKTSIKIDKEILHLTIGENEYLDRLKFAYYVKKNNTVIQKGWYDRAPMFEFSLENSGSGEYEIVIFVRDMNDNQINYSVIANTLQNSGV
ncbi:hypothetical protein QFZ31_004457 [Neobacillus niacini]|uniref:DUF6270 domain-containing protein n=1 Tax=Neobacillus driksii TaxID=3035913 RepID=UPI0027868D72|nr:DUF6270 domain-containing protein [Neobacillus niacini]MDQ0974579.1 hypothetical protein [Neobacillus niacini]